MYDSPEQFAVVRGGTAAGTVYGGFDPEHSVLYLAAGSDVHAADVLLVRGMARRVLQPPQPSLNPFTGWAAGVVVQLEAAPPTLPDLGELARQDGTVFDRQLNTEVPTWVSLWSGPCLVDPPTTEGSDAEAGQQRLTIQPFTVSVPLQVVDVRPEDKFTVTASADPRMVGRPLMVTRVKAASMAQVRQFTTIDQQG